MTDASARLSAQVQTIWEPAKPEPVDVASLNVEERTELWEFALQSVLPHLHSMSGFTPLDTVMTPYSEWIHIDGIPYKVKFSAHPTYSNDGLSQKTHGIYLITVPENLLEIDLDVRLYLTRNGRIVGAKTRFDVNLTRFSSSCIVDAISTAFSLSDGAKYLDFILQKSPQSLVGLMLALLRMGRRTIFAKQQQIESITEFNTKLKNALDRVAK